MTLNRRTILILVVASLAILFACFVGIRLSTDSKETVMVIGLPPPIPATDATPIAPVALDAPASDEGAILHPIVPVDYDIEELVAMLKREEPLPDNALDAFLKHQDEIYRLLDAEVEVIDQQLETMKAEDTALRQSFSDEQRHAMQQHIKSLSPEERSKLNIEGLIYMFGLDTSKLN